MATKVAPERNLSQSGYFGAATSTLDWCEANYQFSYYIAEFANSFSSLIYVAFAAYGILNVSRESLPPRFTIALLAYVLVGLGSFAFHATLLYEYQMADEIPMIAFASTNFWLMNDVRPGFDKLNKGSLALLFLFNIAFTWSYYLYRNPIYHQTVFATIMLSTLFRMTYLFRWSTHRLRIPEEKRSKASWIYFRGAVVWVLAFTIWNLDNIFCDRITSWKIAVGWPVAFLLEGHCWWHFLTGLGTWYLFVGIQFVILCIKDDHRKFTLVTRDGLVQVKRIDK